MGNAVYECPNLREYGMSPRKKRTAKKSSRARKAARKTSSRSRKNASKASSATGRRRKRSKAALPGLGTVRQVGKRTWRTLKSTTAQVVEGVKETLGG
jgi:hypothetical protein